MNGLKAIKLMLEEKKVRKKMMLNVYYEFKIISDQMYYRMVDLKTNEIFDPQREVFLSLDDRGEEAGWSVYEGDFCTSSRGYELVKE